MAWESNLGASPALSPPKPGVPGPLRMPITSGALAPCVCACGWLCMSASDSWGREPSVSVHFVPLPVPAGPRARGRLHLSVTWFPVNMYVCMYVCASLLL